MNNAFLLGLALLTGVASSASWADELGDRADLATLVSPRAELVIGLDARRLYRDDIFDALMTVVEASGSYRARAQTLSAWGFNPRDDVHELVFAVETFGLEDSAFVIVATGDLSANEIRAQLDGWARLHPTPDSAVPRDGGSEHTWIDPAGISYMVAVHVAIVGRGFMFTYAQAAFSAGVSQPYGDMDGTLWMNISPREDRGAALPGVLAINHLTVGVEVDATPSLALRAEMNDPAKAEEGAAELRTLLTRIAHIPEVSAFGLTDVVRQVSLEVEGDDLVLHSELSAQQWQRFSTILAELVSEELR